MMKPLFKHNCPKCEFIGTVFDFYDIYTCPNGNKYSCIARYGDKGSKYISHLINLNREVPYIQSKIGGITRGEAIVLVMFNCMPSLLKNYLKTAKK
ncbi:MAG: hypothetical protein ACTSYW_00515 [Candidatus Heimdallarchaeota archaeon]